MIDKENTLCGRKLYMPQMSYEGARCMAAVFQSIGIDAQPSPPGDAHTYELARRYVSGDECLPELVTLGNFLKVTELPDFSPENTAFMLPTANGPCRFGQYLPLAKQIFAQMGLDNVLFFSTSSAGGYKDIGVDANDLVRTAWHAVITSDILRKLLLKTRPYETQPGATDAVYFQALNWVCDALARQGVSHRVRIHGLIKALEKVRDAFRSIKVDRSQQKLLVGVVGEIFCRLNDFSNDHLIRVIENHGGEAWMSDVSEWIWYTNDEDRLRLIRQGQRLSFRMLGSKLRWAVMHRDEHRLLEPFHEDFRGYEEPADTCEILRRSEPYLPRQGAHGEMVLNVGKAIWYYEKGAAAIVEISPFTCMNGIVCEAIYPRVSRDHNGIPIRVLYFDGLQSNIDETVEIFMELAANYANRQLEAA